MAHARYVTNPTVTETSLEFQTVLLLKIFFKFEDSYISRISAFFPEGWLQFFWSDRVLDSDNTRNWICEVYENACASILDPVPDCAAAVAALPVYETESVYLDGNTQGCRSIHAVFAETNPINHCAHISFTPLEDPSGRIKCQTSKGTPISNLFTEEELDRFARYTKRKGIDPDVGYVLTAA
jgi:hypothetical protein